MQPRLTRLSDWPRGSTGRLQTRRLGERLPTETRWVFRGWSHYALKIRPHHLGKDR